jgi:hypothetical protein
VYSLELGCGHDRSALAVAYLGSRAIPGLTVPFCIFHGTEDAGVPIAGSEFMLNTAVRPDDLKELHRSDGGPYGRGSYESYDQIHSKTNGKALLRRETTIERKIRLKVITLNGLCTLI